MVLKHRDKLIPPSAASGGHLEKDYFRSIEERTTQTVTPKYPPPDVIGIHAPIICHQLRAVCRGLGPEMKTRLESDQPIELVIKLSTSWEKIMIEREMP
ncbi:hypothetical protein EVAR_8474_1 [Eumeta japonica]|uniref:Uncharacterized protein n=1 Tax=Eumeta variegata TaxID=151549 RepID=A0A4C2A918_EUMVA|nr:hypothetical protein EVAR_8474_1 [Eumeta japonica]